MEGNNENGKKKRRIAIEIYQKYSAEKKPGI
jgi:hypothetical protein